MANVSIVVEGTSQIIALCGVAIVLVALFGLFDLMLARRERAKLATMRSDPAVAWAVSEILRARDSFSRVVSRYEMALGAQARVRSRANDGGLPSNDEHPEAPDGPEVGPQEYDSDVERLLEEKQEARERLLGAQRDWDMIRPGAGPAAASDLWFGSGLMRAWQLGFVGFERHFYRFDHALDDSCWSIFESCRFRFGLGFGAESQSLALVVVGASASQLPELSALAFGGPELALRPGFVPMRWWRRIRRDDEVRAANAILLKAGEVSDLVEGPSAETRELVLAALEAELGESLTSTTTIPPGPGLMSVITKGPSVLAGAWTGHVPEPELRASSDHGVWHEPA